MDNLHINLIKVRGYDLVRIDLDINNQKLEESKELPIDIDILKSVDVSNIPKEAADFVKTLWELYLEKLNKKKWYELDSETTFEVINFITEFELEQAKIRTQNKVNSSIRDHLTQPIKEEEVVVLKQGYTYDQVVSDAIGFPPQRKIAPENKPNYDHFLVDINSHVLERIIRAYKATPLTDHNRVNMELLKSRTNMSPKSILKYIRAGHAKSLIQIPDIYLVLRKSEKEIRPIHPSKLKQLSIDDNEQNAIPIIRDYYKELKGEKVFKSKYNHFIRILVAMGIPRKRRKLESLEKDTNVCGSSFQKYLKIGLQYEHLSNDWYRYII